jgi:DHA3 family macrolide efflux protein-like MFS transporter
MPVLLAPLRDRDFRLYFGGESLSSIGSGLHMVALSWYLLARTGSATDVALVWTAGLGSGIAALPLSGPIADRYPRRLLCIGADVWRMALVGVLAALVFAGPPPLWAIYALTFLIGLGHNLFWPSITALLQEIIRPDQLTSASGLVEVTFQVGFLTGGGLGGPLLIRFGLGWVLVVDVVTYAASAVALLAIRHRPGPAEHHDSALAMVRDGIAYLRDEPAVAGFGLVSVLPWVATISLNVVSVAYVLDVMGRTATVYGLGDMTYGVGAVVSGLTAALVVVWLGRFRAMLIMLAALAAAYAIFATGPTALAAFFALMYVAGYCSSGFRVIANSVLLAVVPNRLMGRTSATILLFSMVMQVLATLAIGPLVQEAGPQGGFVLLTTIVVVTLVALGSLTPSVRRLPQPAAETG